MSQMVELLLYMLPLLMQYTDPTISSSTYLRSLILLLSAALPLISSHYLVTRCHSLKPNLYKDFRVRTVPSSVILISVISNRLDQIEFTTSCFISLFLLAFSSKWNLHVLHTLMIIGGHFVLLVLLSPGLGTFVFIMITMILTTIIMFDTRCSFSSSEYLLCTTFFSYFIYQAIFLVDSPSVIVFMSFIAIFLVIPPVLELMLEPKLEPVLERDTTIIFLALFAWLFIIFLKNITHHMSYLKMLTLHTIGEIQSHPILILVWVFSVLLSVLFTLYPTQYLPLTVQRKVFHIFINIVYISGIIVSPHLLSITSFGLMLVFVMLQIFHSRRVQILSKIVNKFKSKQDKGPLILSPIFLLIGLSVPVWGALTNHSPPLLSHDTQQPMIRHDHTFLQAILPLSGVLSIGVGDAAASIIGATIGRIRIKHHKSLEGLLSNIVSQILCVVLISPYLVWSWRRQVDYILLCCVIVMNGILEVITLDIDNLVIPVFVSLCVFEMEKCRMLDMIIV